MDLDGAATDNSTSHIDAMDVALDVSISKNNTNDASNVEISDSSVAAQDSSLGDATDECMPNTDYPDWIEVNGRVEQIVLDETSVFVIFHSGSRGGVFGGILKIDKSTGIGIELLSGACGGGPYPSIWVCGGNMEAFADEMVLDESHIYFTNHSISREPPTYSVLKMSKLIGIPNVLDQSAIELGGIAVDSTYVYWTVLSSDVENSWSVMKVEKEGGVPVAVASGSGWIGNLAIDETSLYWMNRTDKSIMKVDKSGGDPVVLALQPSGIDSSVSNSEASIGLDETHIYFGNWGDGAIRKVDKSGNEPPTKLASIGARVISIVIDETSVYWLQAPFDEWVGCKPVIAMVDKSGGVATTLVSDDDYIGSFAVDDNYIYWSTSSQYSLKRVEKGIEHRFGQAFDREGLERFF